MYLESPLFRILEIKITFIKLNFIEIRFQITDRENSLGKRDQSLTDERSHGMRLTQFKLLRLIISGISPFERHTSKGTYTK